MDAAFWIKSWLEGRTGFHQSHFNDKLTEYFPRFDPEKGQKVLVPLCGKSKDLIWLHGQGLRVHGVELHEQAVVSFFTENQLAPVQKHQDKDFVHYAWENIVVSCGDFFKLNEHGTCDFVYDRAALVALPQAMRKDYVRVIKGALKPGGKCLLIAYEYDPSQMEGPPFSIGVSEIHELYQDAFTIQQIESARPAKEAPRLAAVGSLKQTVYVLQKREFA